MPGEAPAPSDAASVLARALIAFFCSKACPGDTILKAQDWANARGPESAPVIGGFHNPNERHVLRILLSGAAPHGKTEAFARDADALGLSLQTVNSPANANLMALGAKIGSIQ